jgi:hypothetical protein
VGWLLACHETEKLAPESVDVLAPAFDSRGPGPSDTNVEPVVEPLCVRIWIRVVLQLESAIAPVW